MIVVSPRAMAAIARAYHDLRECGREESAEELIASFRDPAATVQQPDPEPPKPSNDGDEEAKEKARLRAQRYRERNGSKPRNSVTNSVTQRDERDASRVTNRDEKRDVQRDDFASRSRVLKQEKVLDSGKFSAESESSSPLGSSQLRPRASVTERDVQRDASRDERDARDVTRRDALRVLKRLQLCLGLTWNVDYFRKDLDAIACLPETEFERVIASLSQDDWVKRNRSLCTPKHVLGQWNRYLEPPQGKPQRGPVPATTNDQFDASGDDFAHIPEASHG